MPTSVTLPWPPPELSPNGRCHWRVKAKAGKKYKSDVFYLCKAAGLEMPDEAQKLHVWLDFFPPDKRCRDEDNAYHSAKFLLDGLAEALGINDKHFVLHPFFHHDEIGGKIVVNVGEKAGNCVNLDGS
jgi:crossover junction endodeoxyribonuclease RusA